VRLSTAAGVGASAFNALNDVKVAKAAGEAASAIRRVVEEAKAVIRPVMAVVSRALVVAGKRLSKEREWERLVDVGLADEEFRRAFNIAGDKRPLYFVYSAGDVEFGAVKARGVRAVAFVSGAKTLRIEVLAEGVEGLAAERVKALGREWVRLATFGIDVQSGLVQLFPRVDISKQVEVESVLAERLPALALTDAGGGGRYIGSPDPTLHLLYALAVGEAVVKVRGIMFTEAGPTLWLESRAPTERVNLLYEEVRRELAELGVDMGVREIRQWAKSEAVETIGEYAEEVKRIAEKAGSVEELRNRLVELFDNIAKKAAEEYRRMGSEKALWRAVGAAVAKRLFAENVDDPVWWTLLLLGDGVVRPRDHELGFAAKPAEAAEAFMHFFARVMRIPLEVAKGRNHAYLSRDVSRAAVKRLFRQLEETKIGGTSVSQLLMAVAEWWLRVGTGGSDPPKLLSLLAFRELAASREGRWLEAWLSYEAVVTPGPEEVEQWLDGVYRVFVERPQEEAVGFDAYFERGGNRFKLHTDFANFRLSCESCHEAARGVLRAVAEALGVKPRWHWNAIEIPAEVGWPMFLRLWARHNVSLSVEEGGRELLRVEVLEARADGTARFRLWYHKWRETRPQQPYVDVEIKSYSRKGGVSFVGYVSANEAKGIYKEHLAEIAELLRDRGVEGVSLKSNGKQLQFSGRFRDSVLARLGIRPELPPGEPAEVRHLDGFKFRVGDREVDFGPKAMGPYEFYAELRFPTRDEAENFARSLKAVGVDAGVAGNVVRLDSDTFFGLLAATNAVPPGLKPLYHSEEDDFRVYASVEEGRMRLYFAVKHEGVWRVAEGLYMEKTAELLRAEREVLEAIRGAVTKALEKLAPERQGHPAEVEEPKVRIDEEGVVRTYRLRLYGHHLTPFLKHAAKDVKAEPAEVRLKGRHIVINAGGVEAEVEFKLLKRKDADFLLANDVERTLALYRSLKEVGVRVGITPKGVKVDNEALWALVAAAVEKAVEKGELGGLPAEVMLDVELLKVYSAGGMEMYTFRAGGLHYYFAVKTEQGWRAAGGKYDGKYVTIHGDAASAIADAINAIYREMGVERRVGVRYDKNRVPYIKLTNVDLELLGLKRRGQ